MYKYRITFLGGSNVDIHAHDPKQAWNVAQGLYNTMEVIQIKHIGGIR